MPFVEFDLVKPESYFDDFLREIAISIAPFLAFVAAVGTGALFYMNNTMGLIPVSALLLLLSAILSLVKYNFTHPNKNYHEANVAGLLAEPKVSGIRSIPCELKGLIIGRGDPGCIFNEDYVLQDESGIIFLDYNQPLFILNKIFALLRPKTIWTGTLSSAAGTGEAPSPMWRSIRWKSAARRRRSSPTASGKRFAGSISFLPSARLPSC